jgi:hypothetical protein
MRMNSRLARASFALVAALVFISAPVGATTTVTMDGVWWQGLAQSEKVVAVQAMIAGLDSGYKLGHSDGVMDALGNLQGSPLTLAAVNNRLAAAKKIGLGDPPNFSQTFGTYGDEINVWYEVHPKRTSILPADLLALCFDDKPILTPADCNSMGSNADK